jgi:hypothetical protein
MKANKQEKTINNLTPYYYVILFISFKSITTSYRRSISPGGRVVKALDLSSNSRM